MISGTIKNKRGFTLMELMIVLIIIAILIAIAIAVFVDIAKKAEHSVLKYNGTYIVKVLAFNIYDYENADRYDATDDTSLNNFLESHLDGHQASRNKDTLKNPKSGSFMVLQSSTPVSGSIDGGRDPAIFITSNSSYAFSAGAIVENLDGTIVAYFNSASPYNVQVYYVDRNGEMIESLVNFN